MMGRKERILTYLSGLLGLLGSIAFVFALFTVIISWRDWQVAQATATAVIAQLSAMPTITPQSTATLALPTHAPTRTTAPTQTRVPTATPTHTPTPSHTPTPAHTPTPTMTPTPLNQLLTTVNARVRGGPGTNYNIQGGLDAETAVVATGYAQTNNGLWLLVQLPSGEEGWMSAQVLDVTPLDLTQLIIETPPPPPVTPTPTIPPIPTRNEQLVRGEFTYDPITCCHPDNLGLLVSGSTLSKSADRLRYVVTAHGRILFEDRASHNPQIGLYARIAGSGNPQQFVPATDAQNITVGYFYIGADSNCGGWCQERYLDPGQPSTVWINAASIPFPAGSAVEIQAVFLSCEQQQCTWYPSPDAYIVNLVE